MNKIIGLAHRANGILGYQIKNGTYVAILQAPKGVLTKVKVIYDDPYKWKKENNVWKWVGGIVEKIYELESDGLYDYYKFQLLSQEKRFKYFFVFDYQGSTYAYGEFGFRSFKGIEEFNYHQFAFTWNYSSLGKYIGPQEWWKQTSWYQIFPRSFCRNKNYIQGIISKLDYIHDLGFNGIYLNPIFEASSDHKYDTIDYFKIDPEFGDLNDFITLVQEVKSRNMRIMLDGVFNHCGYQFAQWKDVLKNRDKSKYKDWFVIWDMDSIGSPQDLEKTKFVLGENKSFGTFANTPTMPRLNWSNPEVSKFILNVIKYWSKLGIDAWRMDVADEVSFEMWRQVKNAFKKINPEGQLLGEIWYDSQIFLNGDQFDSTMNYPFREMALEYFVKETLSTTDFLNKIVEYKYKYSAEINNGLFNLVGSHDTERILQLCNQDTSKTKFLMAWLLLSPGSPSFYYGDEIDAGKDTKNNRENFNWNFDKNYPTWHFIKKIMNFRNKNISSISQGYKLSQVKEGFKITYNNGQEVIFSKKNQEIVFNNKIIKIS